MPAMHLISVDLPAPLSPTSAMTSPSRTSKSTSLSACTEPNDLVIPRSWRSGVSLRVTPSQSDRGSPPPRAPPPCLTTSLLAELLVLPDADVALLEELVLEEPRVVGLRDRDDRNLNGRLLLAAVLAEAVDPGDLLVLQQGDSSLRGRVGLVRDVLVDGHRLPPGDDVLHALRRRVLPRE